jgi:hypothetical protein
VFYCSVGLFRMGGIRPGKQALRLVQTIALPEVKGRLDHMGVHLEKNRLFVAAAANNSLAVVDLTGGGVIKGLAGFKDSQDALFPGGLFNTRLGVHLPTE